MLSISGSSLDKNFKKLLFKQAENLSIGNPSSDGGLTNLYYIPPVTYFISYGAVVIARGSAPVKVFKMRSDEYQKQFLEFILKLYERDGLINGYSIVNFVISLLLDPSYMS